MQQWQHEDSIVKNFVQIGDRICIHKYNTTNNNNNNNNDRLTAFDPGQPG